MSRVTAQAMLDVWDRARLAPANLERALVLLQLSPQNGSEQMAALTIGERDRRLLDLHEDLFGSELAALANCTFCGEVLETRFLVENVRTHRLEPPNATHSCETADGRIEFRLPNSLDLASVAAMDIKADRKARLLHLLVNNTGEAPSSGEVGRISDEAAVAVEQRMSELDPQADMNLEFLCDACGRNFVDPFDIASFLWAELDSWARRLLREVHLLAQAYGWTETETLRLHPSRRQFYVEMLTE